MKSAHCCTVMPEVPKLKPTVYLNTLSQNAVETRRIDDPHGPQLG